jgi:hypothetical protein
MSRMATVIVALLAALFGLTALPSAAVTPGPTSLPAHAYDSHPPFVHAYNAISERGPPSKSAGATAYNSDGIRPLGVEARVWCGLNDGVRLRRQPSIREDCR